MSDITINNTDELEAMRSQMRELKSSLDRQELVNEKLLRRIIARNSGWINKVRNFQLFFLLPFCFITFLGLKLSNDISWFFYWVTVTMVTVSIAFDTYINRYGREVYTTMDLLKLALALERRRRLRRIQMMIGLPVTVLWAIWYYYEISDNIPYSWISILIGGLIGGLIGILITRHMQKTDAEAIGDIRQFIEK